MGFILFIVSLILVGIVTAISFVVTPILLHSYVLAVNKELGALSKFGLFIGKILDGLDKDHLKKAIEKKRLKDLETVNRVNK